MNNVKTCIHRHYSIMTMKNRKGYRIIQNTFFLNSQITPNTTNTSYTTKVTDTHNKVYNLSIRKFIRFISKLLGSIYSFPGTSYELTRNLDNSDKTSEQYKILENSFNNRERREFENNELFKLCSIF